MPKTITIVGLGPGEAAHRTAAAQRALSAAAQIVLRTAVHPGVDDLLNDPRVVSCDDLYEQAASFEELYRRICERVLNAAESGDVVYALPGSPNQGERTVRMIRTASQ